MMVKRSFAVITCFIKASVFHFGVAVKAKKLKLGWRLRFDASANKCFFTSSVSSLSSSSPSSKTLEQLQIQSHLYLESASVAVLSPTLRAMSFIDNNSEVLAFCTQINLNSLFRLGTNRLHDVGNF